MAGVSPAELNWLTGERLGQNGDDLVEEHWSSLRGNTLMGMFRWVRDGEVWFYELMAIEQEGESVLLRIKDFHPRLVGWEAEDDACEFALVQLKDREAVFRELEKPDARWLVYRLEGHDRLESHFAREDEPLTETGTFEYMRQ